MSFNFINTTDETTLDDSPLDSASDDEDSVATYNDGVVTVELSDALITHSNILGVLRNKSSGGTAKTHADLAEATVHQQGVLGEAGLGVSYESASLDERIIEGGGDGGVDTEMFLGGELRTVDIKCPTYADDPWLKVEAKMVDHKDPEDRADAYVVATVEDGVVTYHGWLSAEEVITPDNKRQSRQRGATHKNYTVEGGFRDMPVPEGCTRFDLSE